MTKKIALLVEVTCPVPGPREQLLLVPSGESGVQVWHRFTYGGKGKGNAWVLRESPLQLWYSPKVNLRFPVVGVYVSESDQRALDSESGWAPVLAQKALSALSKLEASGAGVEQAEMNSTLTILMADVATQSATLVAHVRDGRRTRHVDAHIPPKDEATVDERPVVPVVEPAPEAPAEVVVDVPPTDEPEGVTEPLEGVPDYSLAKAYVSRELAGGVSDFGMLDYALSSRDNVLLTGPTGSGKTTLPIAYAAARRLRCYSVSGNAAMEPSQLFGKFIPSEDGGFKWVDGPLTALVRAGGVLILDEFNLISPKILTVLYPLLDSRREVTLLDHEGETIQAHDGLLVVATGNLGYAGTGNMSQALMDRWPHRHDWGYDDKVEEALIKSKSLRAVAKSIRDKEELQTPISTRLMLEFERMFHALGWEYALANFINRFADSDERGAVRIVMSTHESRIRGDLSPAPVLPTPTAPTPTTPTYKGTYKSGALHETWVGVKAPWDL